jgi:N-acetylglucosaminyldiphosphoundecaprenol N-acetyl-beta-D-mannosaminyltransferase
MTSPGDCALPQGVIERVPVLGVGVSAVDLGQAVETILGWIAGREAHYVCVTPAHAVMDCYHDPRLLPIFNGSGLTVPDGMSLVWLLRLKGHRHVGRVYGPDLMLAACQASVPLGHRHFLYGGAPGVAEELAARLQGQVPGLRVAGVYAPPFRELSLEEERQAVSRIDESRADIVWVGLSTPKQERWMAAHLGRIDAPVMIGVGAAFDFLSGSKPQAPRWMQRSGLEWLFRLLSEPRRLWPRYRQYPKFVALVLREMVSPDKPGRSQHPGG